MANRSLGTLTLDVVAKIGGFTGPLDKAARDLDSRSRQMQNSLSGISKIASGIGGVLTGFVAGIASVGTAIAAFKSAVDTLDRLDEISAKTGISTEKLSALSYAAKLTGTDIEGVGSALDKLSKSAAAALDPTSRQAELFKALGVSVKDSEGKLRQAVDLLPELADKFKTLDNDTLEASVAMELFGKSGANMLEFLNLGSDGLEDMGKKARDLGAVFDQETTKAAADLKDEFDNLQTALQGVVVTYLKPLLPLLTELTKETVDYAKANNGAASAADDFAEAIGSIKTLGSGALDFLEDFRDGLNSVQQKLIDATREGLTFLGIQQKIDLVGSVVKSAQPRANGLGDTPTLFPGFNPLGGSSFDATAPAFKTGVDANKVAAEAIKQGKEAKDIEDRLTRAYGENTKAKDAKIKKTKEETEADKLFKENITEINDLIDEIAQKTQSDITNQALQRDDDQKQFLADLQFEAELLGKAAEEQEILNNLRYAGADANSEFGKSIIQVTQDMQAQREAINDQITVMDAFRNGFEDAFGDVLTGTKSVKDAFKDMVDSIISDLSRFVAQKLIEKAFGQMGTTQSGSAGGWVQAFASLFGGARATGGSVDPRKAYLVGENGPELFVPSGFGSIKPSTQTSSSGVTVNQVFNNPQMRDPRSEAQRQKEAAMKLRIASVRNS